jgi:hypothetical protein
MVGVPLGLIDRRSEAVFASALRPDTPTLVALADVTDARNGPDGPITEFRQMRRSSWPRILRSSSVDDR